MNSIMTFISGMTNTLAWPISSIIIVLIIKKPLFQILKNIKRFKIKDAEIDFQDEIKTIDENVKKHNPTFGGSVIYSYEVNRSLAEIVKELAKTSPEAAIPFVWTQIEKEIKNLVERKKLKDLIKMNKNNLSYMGELGVLYNAEIFDKETLNSINGMRMLRNAITHNYKIDKRISYNDAIEYGKTAERIIQLLNNIQ